MPETNGTQRLNDFIEKYDNPDYWSIWASSANFDDRIKYMFKQLKSIAAELESEKAKEINVADVSPNILSAMTVVMETAYDMLPDPIDSTTNLSEYFRQYDLARSWMKGRIDEWSMDRHEHP